MITTKRRRRFGDITTCPQPHFTPFNSIIFGNGGNHEDDLFIDVTVHCVALPGQILPTNLRMHVYGVINGGESTFDLGSNIIDGTIIRLSVSNNRLVDQKQTVLYAIASAPGYIDSPAGIGSYSLNISLVAPTIDLVEDEAVIVSGNTVHLTPIRYTISSIYDNVQGPYIIFTYNIGDSNVTVADPSIGNIHNYTSDTTVTPVGMNLESGSISPQTTYKYEGKVNYVLRQLKYFAEAEDNKYVILKARVYAPNLPAASSLSPVTTLKIATKRADITTDIIIHSDTPTTCGNYVINSDYYSAPHPVYGNSYTQAHFKTEYGFRLHVTNSHTWDKNPHDDELPVIIGSYTNGSDPVSLSNGFPVLDCIAYGYDFSYHYINETVRFSYYIVQPGRNELRDHLDVLVNKMMLLVRYTQEDLNNNVPIFIGRKSICANTLDGSDTFKRPDATCNGIPYSECAYGTYIEGGIIHAYAKHVKDFVYNSYDRSHVFGNETTKYRIPHVFAYINGTMETLGQCSTYMKHKTFTTSSNIHDGYWSTQESIESGTEEYYCFYPQSVPEDNIFHIVYGFDDYMDYMYSGLTNTAYKCMGCTPSSIGMLSTVYYVDNTRWIREHAGMLRMSKPFDYAIISKNVHEIPAHFMQNIDVANIFTESIYADGQYIANCDLSSIKRIKSYAFADSMGWNSSTLDLRAFTGLHYIEHHAFFNCNKAITGTTQISTIIFPAEYCVRSDRFIEPFAFGTSMQENDTITSDLVFCFPGGAPPNFAHVPTTRDPFHLQFARNTGHLVEYPDFTKVNGVKQGSVPHDIFIAGLVVDTQNHTSSFHIKRDASEPGRTHSIMAFPRNIAPFARDYLTYYSTAKEPSGSTAYVNYDTYDSSYEYPVAMSPGSEYLDSRTSYRICAWTIKAFANINNIVLENIDNSVHPVQGALNGRFSAFEIYPHADSASPILNTKCTFASGNLKYLGSKTGNVYNFTFASQFATTNTTAETVESSTNSRMLFPRGCTGFDHGATNYLPYSMSTGENDKYAPYDINGGDLVCVGGKWESVTNINLQLADYNGYGNTNTRYVVNHFYSDGTPDGYYANYVYIPAALAFTADWGSCYVDSKDNSDSLWFTPSQRVFWHILYHRKTRSGYRFAKAKITGITGIADCTKSFRYGIIIFPDNYYSLNLPDGIINKINDPVCKYSDNTVTFSQWNSYFASYGCAFLACNGIRVHIPLIGYRVTDSDDCGYYAVSDGCNSRILDTSLTHNGYDSYINLCNHQRVLYFFANGNHGNIETPSQRIWREEGVSVRIAHPVEYDIAYI